MKHTQGEWIMHNNVFNSVVITKIDSGYKVIGSFTNDNKLIPENEMRANAKLCAAAPDLLESCIKLFEIVDTRSQSDEDICFMAYKTIKKATE